MKKLIRYTIGLVILAALVWGFFQLKKLPFLSDLFKPEKVVIENTPVVVKQIQSLSQLITVSMYNEIVADTTAPAIEKIDFPLLPSVHIYKNLNRLVIIGKVTVNVGIDLQQLHEGDISGSKDSLHIKLPPAEILDAIVNPSGVEVFIEDGEWNSNAVANLKNKIQYLAVTEAQSRGLLTQSETKAKQILTDFFTAAGYKKVVIDFKTNPVPLE